MLGILVHSAGSLKGCAAAHKGRAITTEARAHEMLDKMYYLRAVVEWLIWIVGGERAQVAGLVVAELVRISLVTTEALS